MKKRVAVLLQGYTSGKSGGDIACIRIMQRLPQNLYQLFVYSSEKGIALCKQEKLQAQYFITSRETVIHSIIYTYIRRVIILTQFPNQKYDTIYCSSDSLPDIASALYLKMKNRKAVWIQKVYHIVSRNRLISHLIQHLMIMIAQQWANYVFVASGAMRNALLARGFSAHTVLINYLGYEVIPGTKSRKEEKCSAVFIGRLHQSKGIYDIVSITRKLVTTIPNCTIHIVGQGTKSDTQRLQNDIQTAKLEKNIILHGYLNDTKAWQLAKNTGLIILPSYEEGFSLTISTAIAYHISVIAYKLPLYDELFPGGVTQIQKGNHNEFSHAMIKFWQKMGTVLKRQIPNRYSWDRAAITEMQYV